MISAGLEKMIWQGKAVFKNYSYAFGQAGGIPIPENSLCIILGFKYSGCFMLPNERGIKAAPNIHFLRIESDKTVNDYLIKTHWFKGTDESHTIGDTDYSCYIVAFNNIQIRLACMQNNDEANLSAVIGTPPGEANEPPNPLGYKTENVILEVGNNDVFLYNPLAERNVTKAGNTNRKQMNINFYAGTLPDFAESQKYGNEGYPIINFQLVYVEKAFLNELLSSK